ncbi:MAG TPA: ParB/RepB/Spo0J family partition protein [Gemmobacter sp.]|nr:ParB/RepB/Spo0J family partition protein [Gemmobacter sp.]
MERKTERRGLGRGLSALMADINVLPSQSAGQPENGAERQIEVIPVEYLHPNPNQPRRQFSDAELQDLAASIREKGVLQPLIVRPFTDRPGHFEIVAGERRWRASQIAQLHEVPVLVRLLDDTEVLEVAIIENIQRANLNPIEEAMAFRQLMERFGHTQERLAEALSKSRSYIANLLRLLNLPRDVQDLVVNDKISAGHARALITATDPLSLAQQVVAKGLSVRETEDLVRTTSGKLTAKKGSTQGARSARSDETDADTLALQRDLSANLGMGVSIQHEAMSERGVLTIRYNTLDDLDFLCQALSLAKRDMV